MIRIAKAWAALMGRNVEKEILRPSVIEMTDDDKFLLECEEKLSREQIRSLNDHFASFLRGDAKSAVLPGGIRFVVLRKSSTAK